MGKQGPCHHCGITTTPLWRNGPPHKPVLCNACGSRWRTKGTLENYMPMHAGGCVANDASAQMEWSKPKNGSTRPLQRRCIKRKQFCSGYLDSKSTMWLVDTHLSKNNDEEFSNISSLGSTISSSEVPMHCDNSGGVEFPVHRIWETFIPSKKRTTMYRFRAPFEKITTKFMAIDEPEVSSVICSASDSLALRDSLRLLQANIDLGSDFSRQPIPFIQELESEASSFIVKKKLFDGLDGFKRGSSRCLVSPMTPIKIFKDKDKNDLKRENFPYNKHNILRSSQSPLIFIDLKDLVNFDTFSNLLTYQEQIQLMKTLAPVDTSEKTCSLKHMFESSQFEAALSNFQQLLCKGMFDNLDGCQTIPLLNHFEQLFMLLDLSKSGWMEQYFQLQKASKYRDSDEKLPEFWNSFKDKPKAYNASSAAGESKSYSARLVGQAPIKKSSAIGISSGAGASNESDVGSHYWMYNGSTSMSLSPQGHGLSSGFGSTLTSDEQNSNSEHDLLVNIPSTRSFQQAQLLQLSPSGKRSHSKLKATDWEQGETESGSLIIANTWHMDNASAWDGLIWKTPHVDSEKLFPNGSVINL